MTRSNASRCSEWLAPGKTSTRTCSPPRARNSRALGVQKRRCAWDRRARAAAASDSRARARADPSRPRRSRLSAPSASTGSSVSRRVGVQFRLDLDVGQRRERTPDGRLALRRASARAAGDTRAASARSTRPAATRSIGSSATTRATSSRRPPATTTAPPHECPSSACTGSPSAATTLAEIRDGTLERHRPLHRTVAVPALIVRDDAIPVAEPLADPRPPAPRRPEPVHADDAAARARPTAARSSPRRRTGERRARELRSRARQQIEAPIERFCERPGDARA